MIKDPVTLKPPENKTLAVAQSGPECGGIATFAAANVPGPKLRLPAEKVLNELMVPTPVTEEPPALL